MPLLGFQSRFAELVVSGQKRQTIRAYRKDGRDPKVGDRLYLWTGLRQPGARKLGEATCIRRSEIKLRVERVHGSTLLFVEINGFALMEDSIEALARLDGFESADAMADWFEETHGARQFKGLLFRWNEIEREG